MLRPVLVLCVLCFFGLAAIAQPQTAWLLVEFIGKLAQFEAKIGPLLSTANASEDAACYSRHYSPKHLADHPDQLVTGMTLDLKPASFHLSVTLRGRRDLLETQGLCREIKPGRRWCSVECDGGGIIVTEANARRSATVELERIRMSSCGEQSQTNGIDIYGGIDDRLFLLDTCRENRSHDAGAKLFIRYQDGVFLSNTGTVPVVVQTFAFNDRANCIITIGKALAPGDELVVVPTQTGHEDVRACGRLSKATITTDHGTFHFANIIEAE
jgi:hypothetical protein